MMMISKIEHFARMDNQRLAAAQPVNQSMPSSEPDTTVKPVVDSEVMSTENIPTDVLKNRADIDTTVALRNPASVEEAPPLDDSIQDLNESGSKLAETALSMLNYNTSSVSGTKRGRLACAFAVNKFAEQAFGKPFCKDGNNLSVRSLVKGLEQEGATKVDPADVRVGDIVYVEGHKHVGVVVEIDGELKVVQNLSSKGQVGTTSGIKFPSYPNRTHHYLRLPATAATATPTDVASEDTDATSNEI